MDARFPGDKYTLHHKNINANYFEADWEQVACPSTCASTFKKNSFMD